MAIAGAVWALLSWAGPGPAVSFVENRGQWPEQVLYRALVPGGAVYVEQEALTWVLWTGGPMAHHGRGIGEHTEEPLRMHAYRVHFEHGRAVSHEGIEPLPHYENHFRGNDPERWGTGCASYPEVVLHGIWPGVDLRLDGRHGLKYDLLLAPGADAGVVSMRYEGADDLLIQAGRLHVATSAGTVVEEAPVVWQEARSGRKHVPASYRLQGDRLGFRFQERPDPALPLVIDPVLTFSTYSGSNADNFGFTATYDESGHLYGGGIAFDPGYPTTLGAWQGAFAGGTIDIALTKFSPDGSSLIWSTYLGGALGNETPHSLVVNSNDELFVLGTSGASDFPTSAGCYDASFTSSAPMNFGIGYGYSHPNGVDIVMTHLSVGGDALIGSTYLGGSAADGVNNNAQLAFNYGDSFRGEIALDAQERPVVATSTQSSDMPTTPGAPQGSFGGGQQDAYFFRMDAGLTALLWATYHGGSGDDSGYGVQFDGSGNILVTGGSTSIDMPLSGSPWAGSHHGGVDGYVLRYSPTGNALTGSTFVGTTAYDQCYLVQLNTADEVFIVGQSEGPYPVTPGKYVNPGSAQFIHKFSNDLSTSLWSTVIGTGNGTVDISPSAFLVSDCGQIYLSGWGGVVNANALAVNSTTIGLPVTPDAFQSNTDGSDFYLMVLDPEASDLSYATFFGGPDSDEHVDGGTSRFDKDGNVYQAVCAGCGGNDDFPTTPGAWSPGNNSFNCNLGVFKFDLDQAVAIADVDGPDYICLPDPANFLNLSTGGTDFQWYFGDGNFSTDAEPSHVYQDTGTYTVTLVLEDASGCVPNDTAVIQLLVLDPDDAMIDPVDTLCPGESVQLRARGGHAYAWLPDPTLSDTSIADPMATPSGPTTYYVVVTDSCGTDTAAVDILFHVPNASAGPDTLACIGVPVPIGAQGGISYLWSPANLVNDPALEVPLASPLDTTWFYVTITTPEGCVVTDSLRVDVQTDPPVPLVGDTSVCVGGTVPLFASGGSWYAWTAAPGILDLQVPDPVVSPPASMNYYVLVSNACGAVLDSAHVEVVEVLATAWADTTICPGGSVTLMASGGGTYAWAPGTGLSDPGSASPLCTPEESATYTVVVTVGPGCTDSAQVTVDLHPMPVVDAGPDQVIEFGDAAQLMATGLGSFSWSPDQDPTCNGCPDPVVSPQETTTYTVTLVDDNGCLATDQVTVVLDGTLYVPNSFTPNGDGRNDLFGAIATEIDEFRLLVFNRWGEEIYRTEKLGEWWDGTYLGTQSPIDTYVWRIDLVEGSGEKRTLFGHVNLIR